MKAAQRATTHEPVIWLREMNEVKHLSMDDLHQTNGCVQKYLDVFPWDNDNVKKCLEKQTCRECVYDTCYKKHSEHELVFLHPGIFVIEQKWFFVQDYMLVVKFDLDLLPDDNPKVKPYETYELTIHKKWRGFLMPEQVSVTVELYSEKYRFNKDHKGKSKDKETQKIKFCADNKLIIPARPHDGLEIRKASKDEHCVLLIDAQDPSLKACCLGWTSVKFSRVRKEKKTSKQDEPPNKKARIDT